MPVINSPNLSAAWNGTPPAPAGSVLTVPVQNQGTIGIAITGTFSATLQFEYSQDYSQGNVANPGTWLPLTMTPTGGGSGVTSATAGGNWVASIPGMTGVRVRCSAFTSGSAVATVNLSQAVVAGMAGAGGTTIADGADTVEGATTDAAITTDTTGTINAKLRGLIKGLVSGIFTIPVNANRNGGILHRNAITAVDKLVTPTVGEASAVTESGSSLPASALNYTVSAGNRWGPTVPAALQAVTPTLHQAVRFAITQVAGAVYYDIFLSTDAAPLWVGRITEAQRAAGGFIISTVGTVTAGGGAPAGSIDIGIVGTGLAWNVNPFAANNAYTPATPTLIDCAGYSRAHIHVELAVTDLRSLPTLGIIPFFQDQTSNADWFAGAVKTVNLLTAVGQPLENDIELDVDGATGLAVLIDTISGQGAACSIWVELVR
jgi:hypothetical protein